MQRRLLNIAKFPWRIFRELIKRATIQSIQTEPDIVNAITHATKKLNVEYSVAVLADGAQMENLRQSDEILSQLLDHTPLPKTILKPQRQIFEPSSETALVTVIVPLYNDPIYLPQAIASLKAQSYRNFKAIIVDDASTDQSQSVARGVIKGDPRFELVEHEDNRGVNAARNTGLKRSETFFVTFLDADDFLLPSAIEGRLGKLISESQNRVAGVYGGITQAPETVSIESYSEKRQWTGDPKTFLSAEGECPFNSHAPLLRTDVLRRLGGFDEKMRDGAEDWEMWQRILRHGYVFLPYNEVVGVYRARQESRVRKLPQEHTALGLKIIDAAFQPLATSSVISGTPFVFTRPVSDYRAEMAKLKRLVNYGVMAYMRNPKQLSWFAQNIPTDVWDYAEYHFDIVKYVEASIIRCLGATPHTASTLATKINKLASRYVAELSYKMIS